MESDDVWDDDDGSQQNELDREWEARRQQYYNAGYRDGVEEGKTATVQLGFNIGFAEAGALSHQLGAVKGALTTLAIYAKHCKGATEEQAAALKKVLDLDNREAVLQVYQHMLSKPPSQQQQQAAAAAGQGTLEEQLSSLSLTGADLASAASRDIPEAHMQPAGPPVVERYLQQAQQVLADTGLNINLSFEASSSAQVQAAGGAGGAS